MKSDFPQSKCTVEAVGDKSATLRHEIGFDELRPGGTVSGPVLMAVADCALYVAILGEVYLFCEGDKNVVAHVVGTYSLP